MKIGDLVVYRGSDRGPAIVISDPVKVPGCTYVSVCWPHNGHWTDYDVEYLEVVSESR